MTGSCLDIETVFLFIYKLNLFWIFDLSIDTNIGDLLARLTKLIEENHIKYPKTAPNEFIIKSSMSVAL